MGVGLGARSAPLLSRVAPMHPFKPLSGTFVRRIGPMRRIIVLAAAALGCAGLGSNAAAIVNGEEASVEDYRLDAVGVLIATLPGQPGCHGSVVGTCTLVAENLVVTASHCLLRPDGTEWAPGEREFWVRFRRGVSGAVSNSFPGAGCTLDYQEIRIVHSARAGNADMAVCTLESAPFRIEPISIEYRREAAPSAPILVAGWGFSGECLGGGDPWRLRWAAGTLSGGPQGSILAINECTFSPCVQCVRNGGGPEGDSFQGWAVPNLHDSGAPVLTETVCPSGGVQLRLIGVVMTPNYASRALSWHLAGLSPRLYSTIPCDRCAADQNDDGVVNIHDVFAYISDFMSGHARADADGVPGLAVPDVFAFLTAYFAGCQ